MIISHFITVRPAYQSIFIYQLWQKRGCFWSTQLYYTSWHVD